MTKPCSMKKYWILGRFLLSLQRLKRSIKKVHLPYLQFMAPSATPPPPPWYLNLTLPSTTSHVSVWLCAKCFCSLLNTVGGATLVEVANMHMLGRGYGETKARRLYRTHFPVAFQKKILSNIHRRLRIGKNIVFLEAERRRKRNVWAPDTEGRVLKVSIRHSS
jgi:hypothetical protein